MISAWLSNLSDCPIISRFILCLRGCEGPLILGIHSAVIFTADCWRSAWIYCLRKVMLASICFSGSLSVEEREDPKQFWMHFQSYSE